MFLVFVCVKFDWNVRGFRTASASREEPGFTALCFECLWPLTMASPRGRPLRHALYAVGFKNFVTIGREADATIISPHYMLVTKGRVDDAHAAGLQVVPWTANTPKDWDKLIKAGVDAIISDDPAELIRYLKEKKLR